MPTRNTTGEKRPAFIVENRQAATPVDTGGLRLQLAGLPSFPPAAPARVGVILVGLGRIRALNRRFLKKNADTDILSFRLSRGYGELIISAATAAAQAEDIGHSLEEELVYLVIHGVLHLAGRRDYKPEEFRAMKKEQDGLFARWKESARATS